MIRTILRCKVFSNTYLYSTIIDDDYEDLKEAYTAAPFNYMIQWSSHISIIVRLDVARFLVSKISSYVRHHHVSNMINNKSC